MAKDGRAKSRGKRNREWASNSMPLPKHSAVTKKNKQGNVSGLNPKEVGEVIDWLYQWARDMHAWGQDVRDDIIRLEGQAGFASGDPGDPPDGPPEEDPKRRG
jgi:hypothetical protein